MKQNQMISKMNLYYDDRAPWHDRYMSFTDIDSMFKEQSEIIDYIKPIIAEKNIFEIACGTGNWSALLSKFATTVTASDLSENSITIAKNKFSDIQNLSFIKADAYMLDDIKKTFDVIYMADFYSHIPNENIESFLSNLSKIAHKNTIIISIDMMEKEYFKNEKFYYDSYQNRISTRELPNGKNYEIIKNFPSEESLRRVFQNYSSNFEYLRFKRLERWLMTFTFSSK